MQKYARLFSDVSPLGIRIILGPGKTLYPKFVPVLFYFNEPAKENIDCSSSAQFHQIGDIFFKLKDQSLLKKSKRVEILLAAQGYFYTNLALKRLFLYTYTYLLLTI